MPRAGPVTKDTSTVALGLAQIRIGVSSTNISNIHPALDSVDSIGALANTVFTSTIDVWKLESGFPLMEDHQIPLREVAMLECGFKEITPYNIALSRGIDPDGVYTDVHSGEIALGDFDSRDIDYVRMEARYTFPNGTNYMDIIFPRAQAVPSTEMDLQAEDAVAVTLTFESKRADSEVSGGASEWDDKPLGWIKFT
jgi:hypothetical protein